MHAPPGGKSNFSIGNQFDDDYHKPAFRQQDMNKGRGKYGQDQFSTSNDIFGSGSSNSYQSKVETSKAFGHKKQNYGGYDNYEEDYSFQKPQPRGQQQQQRNNNAYESDRFGGAGYGQASASEPVFGQRVVSGNNSGPTTDKSSVKLHAPPGGKSSIQFF